MDETQIIQEYNIVYGNAKVNERDCLESILQHYTQAYNVMPLAPGIKDKIENIKAQIQVLDKELQTHYDDQSWVKKGFKTKQDGNTDNNSNQEEEGGNSNLHDDIETDPTQDIEYFIEMLNSLELEAAIEMLSKDDMQIIKTMCKNVESSDDFNGKVYQTVYFFNGIGQQVPGVWKYLSSQLFWIIPGCFASNETKCPQYMQLLAAIFASGPLPEEEMSKLDQQFQDDLIDLGFKYLDYYDTKYLHVFYHTLLAYNSQLITDSFSPLVVKLYGILKAPEFGPELIALLNRGEFNFGLFPQCISFINELFTYSTENNVPIFFYTSDIGVLIDILVRGIHNFDELDPMRWQYLDLLKVIIQHGEYKSSQYHKEDITSVMNDMIDSYYQEKDPSSAHTANIILTILSNY